MLLPLSRIRLPTVAASGCETRLLRASSPGIGVHDTQRRRLVHLAQPFLLDDYIPRYQLLSVVDASKKRSLAYAHLRNCNLCPRLCGVNRYETTGICLIGDNVKVNVIAPHFGEEPCIQGHTGSGSVFFSGCNLRCAFCQNHTIAHQRNGFDLTPEELGEWYMKLQEVGHVHNINLVTPEHAVPQVAHCRSCTCGLWGLKVPIVYNTSAFDSLASLELLDGLVDIYLPDFKAWTQKTSRRLLKTNDYAAVARESIRAMYAQVGDLCFTGDGVAKKGLFVRHLVMPGQEDEAKEIYRPDDHVGKLRRRARKKKNGTGAEDREAEGEGEGDVSYAEINRPVMADEVSAVRKAAEAVGLWRFCDPPRYDGFAI
ncbi:radical SAM superfamily protein [Xylariaceae sp. AK1471]|nr:radical SAM superfamily protein [Xylariaceae sp. AK1471]